MTSNFRTPTSAYIGRKIKKLSEAKDGVQYMVNRNPRNLERLRIGYKPDGYRLNKPGHCYWHRLVVNVSGRYLYASVEHFENGTVVQANTNEWAIKKQLYKTKDTAAYINLARVLARRCIQAGITDMINAKEVSDLEESMNPASKTKKDSKLQKFYQTIEENGVVLKEGPRYTAVKPWDGTRPEKPWEILEEDVIVADSGSQGEIVQAQGHQ